MDRIDFTAVKQTALMYADSFLADLLPGGKREGREYVVRNPTRADSSPGSFKINIDTGAWSDFATGDAGGDLVSLYAYLFTNSKQGEAAKLMTEQLGIPSLPQEQSKRVRSGGPSSQDPQTWTPIVPVPASAPEPLKSHSNLGPYVTRWAYMDHTGLLNGYACRFERINSKGEAVKNVLPLTYCQSDNGKREWRFKSFDPPRPLYARDRLAAHPDRSVLIVEGEKCAEAAQQVIGEHYVVTTFMGGSSSTHKTDWTPLAGRDVIVWPDNDTAGTKALKTIVAQLKDSAETLMVVVPPDNSPESWDIADAIEEGWTAEKLLSFIEKQKVIPESESPLPDIEKKRPPKEYIDPMTRAPFRCLGYDRGSFYYLPYRGQQVIELAANQHTSKNLIILAPLQWWWEYFPGDRAPNWQGAVDTMIATCFKIGFYDYNRLRGRGAWFDKGRVVLHHGDHLLVDDKRMKLHEFDSRYIYEAGPVTELSTVAPISKDKAHRLMEALELLAWEKTVSAKLLAGWCVLAPISGALTWRPHVLVTGSSGSGKSTLFERILKPLLGDASIFVLSNTTEAGIRQRLGNDAFPVIFDEAETENQHSQRRMDHVFELIRQASSSSGGAILKGSQDGKAMEFKIRSCFCLASIGVGLQQRSDLSRISVLGLKQHHPKDAQDYFDEFNAIIGTHLTSKWQAGMRARSIKMIPVIRKNITVFSQAVASAFGGNMRAGDQLGTLLAGAYSLSSDGLIDYQEAITWVHAQDWSEQKSADMDKDEVRCLDKILQHTLVVNQDARRFERSVVSLIALAGNVPEPDKDPWEKTDTEISQRDAEATLARNGIRLNQSTNEVVISNSHNSIKHIMHDTPWARGWYRILKRLDGASDYNAFRFEAGIRTRAVGIPTTQIFEGIETN